MPQPYAPMLQITNLNDLVTLGGFDPNKYMMQPAQQPQFIPTAFNPNNYAQNGFHPTNQMGSGLTPQPAPQAANFNKKKNGGPQKSPAKRLNQKGEKRQYVTKNKDSNQAAAQPC